MTADDPAVSEAPPERGRPSPVTRLPTAREAAGGALRWLLTPAREAIIPLAGVPGGYRLLVRIGYLAFLAALVAALAVELLAERGALPTMVVRMPSDAPDVLVPAIVPALMLATSAIGLALVFTGGSDRGLGWVAFVVSIWIATPILLGVAAMGPRSRSGRDFDVFNHMDRWDGLLLLGAAAIAAITLLPVAREFWHAHPVLEFCLWAPLLPALALIQALRGATWERLGEAMALTSTLSLLVLLLLWTFVGWDLVRGSFTTARWAAGLLALAVPSRPYRLFVAAVVLLAAPLFALGVRAAGGAFRTGEFFTWVSYGLLGCLAASVAVWCLRRWTVRWAATALALVMAVWLAAVLAEARWADRAGARRGPVRSRLHARLPGHGDRAAGRHRLDADGGEARARRGTHQPRSGPAADDDGGRGRRARLARPPRRRSPRPAAGRRVDRLGASRVRWPHCLAASG